MGNSPLPGGASLCPGTDPWNSQGRKNPAPASGCKKTSRSTAWQSHIQMIKRIFLKGEVRIRSCRKKATTTPILRISMKGPAEIRRPFFYLNASKSVGKRSGNYVPTAALRPGPSGRAKREENSHPDSSHKTVIADNKNAASQKGCSPILLQAGNLQKLHPPKARGGFVCAIRRQVF